MFPLYGCILFTSSAYRTKIRSYPLGITHAINNGATTISP